MAALHERIRWHPVIALFLSIACTAAAVEWSAVRTVTGRVGPLVLTPDGNVVRDSVAELASLFAPTSVACQGSARFARAAGMLFAVWWSPRADSGVRLLAARSWDEGRSWSAAVAVDTVDRGMGGCLRASASIAADSATGYVHISYGLLAPEGPGLFFAHSMDRGATFHAPVPILYGERLGRTSVAADGDRVAVAFEDPNSRTPRIGLALSRTMGHIFEDRLVPVSDDNGRATEPLVAVQGRRVTVAWQERAASNGGVVLRVRAGTLH